MPIQYITFNLHLVGTSRIIQMLQGMAPELEAVAPAAMRRHDQKQTRIALNLIIAYASKATNWCSLQTAHLQPLSIDLAIFRQIALDRTKSLVAGPLVHQRNVTCLQGSNRENRTHGQVVSLGRGVQSPTLQGHTGRLVLRCILLALVRSMVRHPERCSHWLIHQMEKKPE